MFWWKSLGFLPNHSHHRHGVLHVHHRLLHHSDSCARCGPFKDVLMLPTLLPPILLHISLKMISSSQIQLQPTPPTPPPTKTERINWRLVATVALNVGAHFHALLLVGFQTHSNFLTFLHCFASRLTRNTNRICSDSENGFVDLEKLLENAEESIYYWKTQTKTDLLNMIFSCFPLLFLCVLFSFLCGIFLFKC